MTLKVELESLDGVDENIRGLYEEQGGKFRLKVDGLEDTGALKRAKDHEKQARKQAELQAKELQDQIEALREKINAGKDDDAKKKGDIEALEKSWQDKLTKREKELLGQIDGLNGNLRALLVDREAVRIASELAVEGSAGILVPHIKSRLGVEQKEGQFVTVVNDGEGKPSALTLDELKQEFANNAAFAPVIVGSKASGGGAGGGKGGSAANSGDLSKMSRKEKLEYFRNQKT